MVWGEVSSFFLFCPVASLNMDRGGWGKRKKKKTAAQFEKDKIKKKKKKKKTKKKTNPKTKYWFCSVGHSLINWPTKLPVYLAQRH